MSGTADIIGTVAMNVVFLALGVVVGPAFTRIRHTNDGVRLSVVREVADDSTMGLRERISRRRRDRPSTDELSGGDKVALGLVVTGLVIWAYMTYRAPVLVALIGLSLIVAVIATIALMRLARAGVIADGRGIATALVAAYLAAAVGFVDVALLWDPPAGGRLFREFVAAFQSGDGIGSSLDGAVFVAYQIIGAFGFLLVGLFSVAFSFSLLAALSIYRGMWGAPLHRLTYGVTAFAWSTWIGATAVILGLLSILFSGGWAFILIQQLGEPPRLSE